MLSRSIFSKAADDEETTLGNKRHTNLTDTSDLESIKSTSSISAPVMTTLKAPSHRQYYQSSLSPHQRDTPIILFPPPPPPPQFTPGNPTSLEVDESDFVDIFVKPQVDTSSNNNNSSTPGVLSPTTICYEMEDAVPWRVLEADDTDEPTLPRTSSVSSHRKEESWLSLYDEDTKEEDDPRINTLHLSSSFSSSSSSPTVMSEWLTRRGDSFDGMREQVGRTSRSIRRWCRNVNKLDDDLPHEDSRLHVVHEEQSQ
ncbi:hypothetical protein BC941DRAFT_455731 [Chlamydoabsidia padenii]|nr:hypothetical protein BC941DRAFT_455731 [Chlamydoabsidia padenii]